MKSSRRKDPWHDSFLYEEPPVQKIRPCDHPGCDGAGEFRAPRSRQQLNEYYWFCLDHVRAYNASWDFYKGMSVDDIERELRQSTTWDRQTWPLGSKTSSRRFTFEFHDPLGVFEEEAEEMRKARTRPLTAEEAALQCLELQAPITVKQLKTRYKQLVKQHHPDANGGDKQAEEKFKEIAHAYKVLLDSLTA